MRVIRILTALALGGLIMININGCSFKNQKVHENMKSLYGKIEKNRVKLDDWDTGYGISLDKSQITGETGKIIQNKNIAIEKSGKGFIKISEEEKEDQKYGVEEKDGKFIYEKNMPEEYKELEEVFDNLDFDKEFFKSLKILESSPANENTRAESIIYEIPKENKNVQYLKHRYNLSDNLRIRVGGWANRDKDGVAYNLDLSIVDLESQIVISVAIGYWR